MRSSNGPSKLFIGDLGDNRKSDLARLFSKYGEISTIYIDENKRFAFIEFTSPIDAQRALEHTHNKTLNGSKLRVEYAKSDKNSRDSRRPVSDDRSPTSTLYSHLQVTANRLPPMQVFRQGYYQHYSVPMTRNGLGSSRGRSLTPPSFKQNSYLSQMHSLRSQDPYYHYPPMYSDSAYYRTYEDPYLMQRLPPLTFIPSTSPPPMLSSSRTYRYKYSSPGINRYAATDLSRRSRSRSQDRALLSHRDRSSRERKHKRRTSSSSLEQNIERGPRTPPPKSSTKISRKRSRSSSNTGSAISDQKSLSHSPSKDMNDEIIRSSSKRLLDGDSDQKHSKKRKKIMEMKMK